MTAVTEAVILMAGQGSRLRDKSFLKPFAPVLGRPLISYALNAFTCAGIKAVHFVVGYESERTIAQLERLIPSTITACFIKNREWQLCNGVSLLAAAGRVHAPFLLTMGDHLFEEQIIDGLLDHSDPGLLNLAVDRKLDSIFDLDDAMKIQTRGQSIAAIGKHLRDYDAIDTGLFVCPSEVFDYLRRARSDGGRNDCSIADAVRLMAADNKAIAIDIADAWWQDVDTPEMLQHAEEQMSRRVLRPAP